VTEPVRILVTNDDGIEAPGLWCQAEAWSAFGEVLVVAPAHEQSGAGTSFTYRRELQIREVESRVPGIKAYSVDGTPSDCVTVGLRRLRTGRVSVVSAGVNSGANLGRGVLGSGTLGAALQGHYRGLLTFCISMERGDGSIGWETARLVVERLAKLSIAGRLPNEPLLNVNIPAVEFDKIEGWTITRMALAHYQRLVEETNGGVVQRRLIVDPGAAEPGTDVWALQRNMVTITPLSHDLTYSEYVDALQDKVAELFD
jgi:5'-nucleotidase